jgi:hypothetical protein
VFVCVTRSWKLRAGLRYVDLANKVVYPAFLKRLTAIALNCSLINGNDCSHRSNEVHQVGSLPLT